METGKKSVESVEEATANIAASAKSGMDKTKATMQEKVDKMSAKDDYEKAIATEKKEQRITEAELQKQQAMSHNAAEKDAKTAAAAANQGTGGGLAGIPTEKTGKQHIAEAELHKHAMNHDAADEKDAKAAFAANQETGGGLGGILGSDETTSTRPQYSHSTTEATGHPTGAHQMSAMPVHGSGEPGGGHVIQGTQVGSHPIGKATETTTAQNTHVGGGTGPGYTGTGYNG